MLEEREEKEKIIKEFKVYQIPGCIVAEVGMLRVCLSDNRVDLVAAE